MALTGLSPPPAFLPSPGEPTIPFTAWIRMFDNYVVAISEKDDDIPLARKRALLIHCVGTEAQRIFYNLPVADDSYAAALKAFEDYFVPRVNTVAERNKFRQLAQLPGESTLQYVAALRELRVNCDFGALADDMIRDQIIEKTTTPRIRERLLLETNLTLAKAINIASLIENALAEAKNMTGGTDTAVQAINTQSARGGKFRKFKNKYKPRDKRHTDEQSPRPPQTAQGKTCYRCGSTAHLANDPKCPAASVQFRGCSKVGHFQKVCRSAASPASSTRNVREVTVVELDVLAVNTATTNPNKITCNVSLHTTGSQNVQTNLVVDTGSAVSILPESIYNEHFKNAPLSQPDLRLVTYLKEPIPVLGCLALTVTHDRHVSQGTFFIVPSGTPLLGMDLFTALHMEIRDGHIATTTPTVQNSPVDNVTESLGVADGFVHKVKTRSDVQPIQQKLRRLPFAVRDAVSEELKRLEAEGIIERIDSSPWVSPIVVVQKRTGGIRLCVDLREPNKAVVIDSHPLPHIEEVFTELRGAKMYSSIDLQTAYHQVSLHPDSRDLTAFITHDGLFRFTRVPYGLASAPSAFQKIMTLTLAGQQGVQCYLDDIIVYGKTEEEHNARLQAVLQRLNDSGFKLNMEKCHFRKTELAFLGHVISESGLRPNPDHISAVADAPPPQDAQALRSFLGLTAWYSKFIPNYATLVEPLRALLRKSTDYCWTETAQTSFDRVKQSITNSPALALFDPSLPTIVTTDASDYGIGAVLTQLHGNTEKTVAFASRTLSECERKYSTVEKEALGCVWATEKWRTYLWGRHFTLRTDHSPLTTLLSTKGLGRAGMRIARWSARLLSFHYDIEYKPGRDNVTADCLSRLPLPVTDPHSEPDIELIALVSADFAAVTAEQFQHSYRSCPVLKQVESFITNGWPRTSKGLDPALVPYFKARNELVIHNGYIIRGTHRVTVPADLQPKLIQLAHDTHQGIIRTKQRLRDLYWWPGMTTQVDAAVKTCVTCSQHDKTAVTRVSPLQPVPLPNGAWEKLAIDIVGPFNTAAQNCRYAITLIDYYSKWPEVAFTSEVTSASVITFLSTIFSREGNPQEIVSDNGTQFVSTEFEAFLADRDIKHCRSSVYYPQANGEIERFNRVLKDCLQTADIEKRPWKPFATAFLHTYRATPHAVTQMSPADLLHGRPMNTKLHIRGVLPAAAPKQTTDLRQTVQRKQGQSKEYTDRRRGAKPSTFQSGSYVRIKKPGIIKKGHSAFTQPYRVLAQKGPATYQLSDGKLWNAIHLAPANPPATDTPATLPPEETFMPTSPARAPPARPCTPPAARASSRVRTAPAWTKDYVT